MKQSQTIRWTGILFMTAVVAAGCGEKPGNGDAKGAKVTDTIGPSTIKKDGHEFIVDTAPMRRGIPVPPPNGSVSFTVGGELSGTWSFDDVTLTVAGSAQPEKGIPVMNLEAHKSPPDEHFKIRLYAQAAAPGTYTIDPKHQAVPRIESVWEHQGLYFIDGQGSSGSMTITKAADGRMAGTYDVVLALVRGDNKTVKISGTFDVKVQK